MTKRPHYVTAILIFALLYFTYNLVIGFHMNITGLQYTHQTISFSHVMGMVLKQAWFYVMLAAFILTIIMFFGINWARITYTCLLALYFIVMTITTYHAYYSFMAQLVTTHALLFKLIRNSIIGLILQLIVILPLYGRQANKYFLYK